MKTSSGQELPNMAGAAPETVPCISAALAPFFLSTKQDTSSVRYQDAERRKLPHTTNCKNLAKEETNSATYTIVRHFTAL